MFSYVFMKILEAVPHRYDRAINLVSRGHADRVLDRVVSLFIEPGMRVLDVGCGTGTLAVSAALKGARVTGLDVSQEMLAVARRKASTMHLEGEIEFVELDALDLDERFDDGCFDCVVSTLLLSELLPDEREFVLGECHRVLKEDGTLVIAAETDPPTAIGRLLHRLARLPVVLFTLLLSGKSTRAVPDLAALLERSGFEVETSRHDLAGSFTTLSAGRGVAHPAPPRRPALTDERPGLSLSPVIEHLFRWFPSRLEPGLRAHGNPDRDSPLLITANYTLTGKRLAGGLGKLDCYVLVVPTGGINVWCSSCEGTFNARAVAGALKSSRVAELLDHRRLILPQLCAPGVNRRALNELTDWSARFGPVRARDIPSYIEAGYRETAEMRTYRFDDVTRLDLALSMNFQYFIIMQAIASRFRPEHSKRFALAFWSQTLTTYMLFDRIPGKSGITRALVAGLAVGTGMTALEHLRGGGRSWGWLPVCLGLGALFGFDLAGITGVLRDEPLMLANRLGIKRIGPFTVHELGTVHLDEGLCIGCGACRDVCPRNVFAIDEERHKARMASPDSCVICKACITQCSEGALSLTGAGKEIKLSQATV